MKDESDNQNVINIADFGNGRLPHPKITKTEQQDANCMKPAEKKMYGYTRSPGGNVRVDEAEGDGENVCSYICFTVNSTDTRTGKVSVVAEFKDHQDQLKTILVPCNIITFVV